MCWINPLVSIYYWTSLLVDVLRQRIGCCVRSTCWFKLTDASTYWVDMLVDVYWLMNWRDGLCAESTCSFLNCFAQCNCCRPIVAFDYKKKQEKKLYTHYIFKAGWKPSFCCSCIVKYKIQYHPNRGTMQYIHVKQAL